MTRHRLVARRKALGLTQEGLAERLDVAVSTVARWERCETDPRPWQRSRLADALGVNLGTLDALLAPDASRADTDPGDRPPIPAGVDPDELERLALAIRRPTRLDAQVMRSLATVLAEQRRTEDLIGAAPLVAPVSAQLELVTRLVREARGPLRPAMVDIAAQWAQFLAWLTTSTGERDAAQRWWDRAAEWATEADNATLFANTLSFRGHLAWMRGDVGPTIGLSQAAQRDPAVFAGQRAYDAYQEARGHALAGDTGAAERKLDDGSHLAQAIEDRPDDIAPWSYYYSPALFTAEQGLVYLHLSFHDAAHAARAVSALEDGIAGLSEGQGSDWAAEWRYRLALAHLQNDDPVQACTATTHAASVARSTDFVRLLASLRRLHARLAERYPRQPAVTELGAHLAETA